MSQRQSEHLRQKEPQKNYQHEDEKYVFTLLNFSQRIDKWANRLPLVWRVIGGIAIGITILASAGYIVSFIKELFMLGVICLLFIGFAVSIFGGGSSGRERREERSHVTGFTKEEWDDYCP